MENASKALIIAGGMLIAILVVSLLVIGWNNLTSYNQKEDQLTTAEQIIKFNKEFESYNKNVLRGYDLLSLANLITDTNERYSETEGFKPVEAYILFNEDYGKTLLDRIDKKKHAIFITGNGIEITRFRDEYYRFGEENKPAGEPIDIDLRKIFKEYYFECTKTVYDGEEENDKGTARISKLYFSQIAKK